MAPRTIEIINQVPKFLKLNPARIRSFLRTLDHSRQYAIPDGSLSIAFMNNAQIAQVHADFMQDPTPTDVITFPGDPLFEAAGELCISAEYALAAAKTHRTSLNYEILLYLTHGWLHLAGLDDLTGPDAQVMRAAEKQLLEPLRAQFEDVFELITFHS